MAGFRDSFDKHGVNLSDPAIDAVAVVEGTEFTCCRALYVGTAGDVTVVMKSGNTAEFTNVANGTILPIRCIMVTSATTASDILALR